VSTYVTAEDIIRGADPHWDDAGKVHDWRNHVPDGVKELWLTFTPQQRKALYQWADDLAGREEWE
jgi:hypothetical protein